jgi:acetyltransferase-like isoleucine patch superfamily enzyme
MAVEPAVDWRESAVRLARAARRVTRPGHQNYPPAGLRHELRRWNFSRQCEQSPRRLRLVGSPRLHRSDGTRLLVGDDVIISGGVVLYLAYPGATIQIGNGAIVNFDTKLMAAHRITIGDGTFISWDVTIMDTDFHTLVGARPDGPVTIGDRVWIGAKATIAKGVTIGDGAVVAAGSLVLDDVPAGSLVMGTPAKVVRRDVSWHP